MFRDRQCELSKFCDSNDNYEFCEFVSSKTTITRVYSWSLLQLWALRLNIEHNVVGIENSITLDRLKDSTLAVTATTAASP